MTYAAPDAHEAPIPPFDYESFMASLEGQLTAERAKIVLELAQQPWFQATDPGLQQELATLPQDGAENHDGFLADLANRPSQLGGITVESLAALPRGKFALTPMFNVRRDDNGMAYTYEYVSWRYGPLSGAKGVVFIRPGPDEEPTHLIVLVGDKFATGDRRHDLIGGFIDLGVEGVQGVTDRVLVETRQELGVEDLQVDEVVNLGQVHLDPGMSNNQPMTFIATISTAEASRIPSDPINPDVRELKAGALIVPVAQLRELINNNTDAMTAACILKALTSHEVAAPIQTALFKALAVGNVALQGILNPGHQARS